TWLPADRSALRSGSREQQAAAQRPAAGRGHRDLGIARHLPRAALAPQLHARLVQEAVAVQPPRRELTAVRVERNLAVERDARAALDERPALPLAAEAERLEPRHREEAEAVVALGD